MAATRWYGGSQSRRLVDGDGSAIMEGGGHGRVVDVGCLGLLQVWLKKVDMCGDAGVVVMLAAMGGGQVVRSCVKVVAWFRSGAWGCR